MLHAKSVGREIISRSEYEDGIMRVSPEWLSCYFDEDEPITFNQVFDLGYEAILVWEGAEDESEKD